MHMPPQGGKCINWQHVGPLFLFSTTDAILSHDLIMAEPVVKATFVSMPNIRDSVWEYSYSAELHHLLVQRYNGKELRYVEHKHS